MFDWIAAKNRMMLGHAVRCKTTSIILMLFMQLGCIHSCFAASAAPSSTAASTAPVASAPSSTTPAPAVSAVKPASSTSSTAHATTSKTAHHKPIKHTKKKPVHSKSHVNTTHHASTTHHTSTAHSTHTTHHAQTVAHQHHNVKSTAHHTAHHTTHHTTTAHTKSTTSSATSEHSTNTETSSAEPPAPTGHCVAFQSSEVTGPSINSASSVNSESSVISGTSTESSQQAENFETSIGRALAAFVDKTVSTLHYTAYKLGGTHFDAERGVYIVDCSDYVDHVLSTVYPHAYENITQARATDRPTAQDYYSFFTELSTYPQHYWNKVSDVEQLQPGDVLVFVNHRGRRTSDGHVMIVMSKPQHDADTYFVRVADSARAGHSADTRHPHFSGIGIGTLALKADTTSGQPYAYAWKVGSRWDDNVGIAMARPV